jgi:hypothetical protein
MSVKSKTIDNLGVDASIRYAKDQEAIDVRFIQESQLVPPKTEVSVAIPYTLSEFDQIYSLEKKISWALFSPPPNYLNAEKSLFSYLLIPSLGDYEKLEADLDKIEGVEDLLKKPHKKSTRDDSSRDEKQDEKERKTLLALLQCIGKLNKILGVINSRRNQYQRG